MDILANIRAIFAEKSTQGGFEYGISEVASQMNGAARDAANFQLIFDLLYWDYTAVNPKIDPKELDRITLKYSRFGEAQEAQVASQIQSASEWVEALEANSVSPSEGLGLSKLELGMVVEKERTLSSIAQHPSHLSVPLEICRLMRNFYRAQRINHVLSVANVLKPLHLSKEVISKSSSTGEELKELVTGRIAAFMRQVRANTAKGRWVIPKIELEIGAIDEFADFIVFHLLNERWKGDKSMFSQARGIGLVENAVFYLYLLEEEKEKKK